MLRIFVGHDPLQPVSTTVLVHSIISRASKPVCVTPLSLKTLPIKRRGLTEFTYSRFLVPYLCDYQGWSLFLDTDFVAELPNHPQCPQLWARARQPPRRIPCASAKRWAATSRSRARRAAARLSRFGCRGLLHGSSRRRFRG
jgi:hypothetical protein